MNEMQILEAIMSLARSQGFYGRLLQAIENDYDILEMLVAQNFKDTVEMILFLEC